jgi:transcription antitermination protein NusB
MNFSPAARRNARHYALQAMYQWQLSQTPTADIESQFLNRPLKKKMDLEFFKELIHTVPKRADELDQHMLPFLNRSLKELDPIELAILRLGIYELAYRLDIPYPVVINESLELTKKFGSIEGYKFVNGILDQVARKIRAIEVNASKKKI